jgi:hypothetical protein
VLFDSPDDVRVHRRRVLRPEFVGHVHIRHFAPDRVHPAGEAVVVPGGPDLPVLLRIGECDLQLAPSRLGPCRRTVEPERHVAEKGGVSIRQEFDIAAQSRNAARLGEFGFDRKCVADGGEERVGTLLPRCSDTAHSRERTAACGGGSPSRGKGSDLWLIDGRPRRAGRYAERRGTGVAAKRDPRRGEGSEVRLNSTSICQQERAGPR